MEKVSLPLFSEKEKPRQPVEQTALSQSADPRHVVVAQPRAPYGPHVMGPPPATVAAARLLYAKPELGLSLQDGNLGTVEVADADIVGLNVLGAPNFPEVQNIIARMRSDQHVVLGGQVVRHLPPDIRSRIFKRETITGNDDAELARALNLDPSALPRPEAISLIPAYQRFTDEELRTYLTQADEHTSELKAREISFYLSQGCGFSCNFCAADKGTPERYRDMAVVEQDLRYLMGKADSFGVRRIEMYLSNLDLFQTPKKLMEFAGLLNALKAEALGFTFGMRGLSTTSAFVNCHNRHPEIIEAMRSAGLNTIGFGIDGTPSVWERINKPQNSEEKNLRAVQICHEYGITPEVLMIIGQPDETPEELAAAFDITKKFVEEYGAASRPHVYKPLPGSDRWDQVVQSNVMELLLQNRDAWTAFDVLAGPSPVSHPDEDQRRVVASYFERYLALPVNRTAPVHPLGWWLSPSERREAEEKNALSHDR